MSETCMNIQLRLTMGSCPPIIVEVEDAESVSRNTTGKTATPGDAVL